MSFLVTRCGEGGTDLDAWLQCAGWQCASCGWQELGEGDG
jgi:hypothetical protein